MVDGSASADLPTIVLLDPGTYIYYNATMQRNQDAPVSYDGSYSTDLIANKSIELLQEAKAASQPFFLGVTPIGPHSQVVFSLTSDQPPVFEPPVPAIRHQDLYPNVTVPRTPNFNPNVVSVGECLRLRASTLTMTSAVVQATY